MLTSCSSAFLLPLRVRVRSALPPSCFLFAFLLLFRFVLFFVLLLPLPLSVSCSPSYCLFDFLCVVRLASSSSRLLSSFALLVLLVRVGSFSSVRASFCGIGVLLLLVRALLLILIRAFEFSFEVSISLVFPIAIVFFFERLLFE